MKRFALAAIASFACFAAADYDPTHVTWKSWTVTSSEDLFMGAKYKDYPLTLLFDGDTTSAWVYSSRPGKKPTVSGYWKGPVTVRIEKGGGVVLDEVGIFGGYGKSGKAFTRNNRVRTVAIYEAGNYPGDDKLIKTVDLQDAMLWQSVRIPRKKYQGISLVFKDFYQGTDKDIAISEVELRRDGKNVMSRLPQTVLSTLGSECGCGSVDRVATPKGQILARGTSEFGTSVSLNAAKTHWAALELNFGNAPSYLRVVDAERGKVTRTILLPQKQFYEFAWISGNKVRLAYMAGKKPRYQTYKVK